MTSLLAALFQPWQISCKTFQQLFTFVLELRVEKTLENLSKLLLFPEKGIESTIALAGNGTVVPSLPFGRKT